MEKKICANCKQEFEPNEYWYTLCGICFDKQDNRPTCRMCGKRFKPSVNNYKYCDSCGLKLWKKGQLPKY